MHKIKIIFKISSMTQKYQELYFRRSHYLIEEVIIIAKHLITALKDSPVLLKSGKYPNTESASTFSFKISKH